MLTKEQAEVLARFERGCDFDAWDGPEGDTVRWFLSVGYIRSDAQNGPDRFVQAELGKQALGEYRQDRADRADRKREKKQERVHDFVVAAFGAIIGVVGTLVVQVVTGLI